MFALACLCPRIFRVRVETPWIVIIFHRIGDAADCVSVPVLVENVDN